MCDRRAVTLRSSGELLGSIPDRSPACEALITRVATDIEARTDAIAERLVERIADEMEDRKSVV